MRYLIPIILLSLFSCEFKTDKRLNADRINKGMDRFKIKRITDDQIVASAYEKGAMIAQNLMGKISTDSLCEYSELKMRVLENQELIETAQIRCGIDQTTHEKERELWLAYEAAFAENKDKMPPTIQRLGDKNNYENLVYTFPLNRSDTLAMLSIVMPKREIIKAYKPEK
ncbi:MAG: hypothetical protein ACI85I_001973 [Arenicella sp.]|jgi:hypothetical protein